MKTPSAQSILLPAAMLLCLGAAPAAAQDAAMGDMTMINPSALKWVDAPPGLPKGAKLAVLYGDPGNAPWQVQANKGQFMEADDLVHLTGDVRVSQQAQGGRPLTLTTSTLTLDNTERTVYTDAPVELTDSFSLTRATGMKAWIDDRILELDSDVEGRYETGK